MRDPISNPFVGLDIGTSTVRCVVGMINPDNAGKLSIIGHGSASNVGMRRGIVVHVDDVAEAIVQALTEAERVSGMQIHGATINVNGSHIIGLNSKGVIAISGANREIAHEDRLRAEEAATIMQMPSNREIIQVFAKNYRLDGQENIKDPVGMHGVRLEVDTHIVTASTPNLRNLDMALEKAQLGIHHHTLSGLAAAEAVMARQQKEAGTLLLDVGAGTTNVAILEDGEVQHVAIIPMGSMHITNDLAIGLKTDLDIAEAVKIKYATLNTEATNRNIQLKVEGKIHIFKSEDIYMITESRVEELFDYVQKELKRVHKDHKLPGGVVIVGGGSKLPGIAEFAKERLQLAVRIGKLQSVTGLIDTVDDPSYATAVGLMMLDMLLTPDTRTSEQNNTSRRALKIFDDFLGRFKR